MNSQSSGLRWFTVITIFCLVSIFPACTSTEKQLQYGIVQGHAGYVPARIAVVPCRSWPTGARFRALPMTNLEKKHQDAFCKRFDKFIIDGFRDQPYMKGYTPSAVAKLLKKAGKPDHLLKVDSLWSHDVTDCLTCQNFPSFYQRSIADRPTWRAWLNQISQASRSADSILFPFILFANKEKSNDRGILVSSKTAGLGILLIDTNNGNLIWSNARFGEISNQFLEKDSGGKHPEFPNWTDLDQRVFVEAFWREFPGRQVY